VFGVLSCFSLVGVQPGNNLVMYYQLVLIAKVHRQCLPIDHCLCDRPRQPRRRLSHSVGPNTRQTSDSAIKTPTGRPIPKQSSDKSNKGPTKREIEIADFVNNSIKSESFVTTLVPMITDAIQHNLELTIRQTISAAITTSMIDMQNIITNQQILLSNQQRTIEGLTNKTKKLDEIIESESV
jgi:hypothetical protein